MKLRAVLLTAVGVLTPQSVANDIWPLVNRLQGF